LSRVRVVTDSTVRFSTPGFLARHPVAVAPLTLRCHLEAWEESPEDEIDSARLLFERCRGFPLAEPPSIDRMAEAYGQLAVETDQIVSIHASAYINPTVHNAQAASQKFLGRCAIHVVDSQTLSSGLGLFSTKSFASCAAWSRACTWWSSSPT